LSRPRDFGTARGASRSGLALTVAGGLALALAAQQALAARGELRQAEARVIEAKRETSDLRERMKQSEARPGPAQAALVRAVASTMSPPSAILRDLVALMPGGVRLDRLELTYGPEVEVSGLVVARRPADYDAFLDRLSSSSRFGALEPGPETREDELRVAVRAVYRGEGER
jgi:Tfp pilus assembly protein PilN